MISNSCLIRQSFKGTVVNRAFLYFSWRWGSLEIRFTVCVNRPFYIQCQYSISLLYPIGTIEKNHPFLRALLEFPSSLTIVSSEPNYSFLWALQQFPLGLTTVSSEPYYISSEPYCSFLRALLKFLPSLFYSFFRA